MVHPTCVSGPSSSRSYQPVTQASAAFAGALTWAACSEAMAGVPSQQYVASIASAVSALLLVGMLPHGSGLSC